jgi:hypothetical protein
MASSSSSPTFGEVASMTACWAIAIPSC